jgi:hypothetical protein
MTTAILITALVVLVVVLLMTVHQMFTSPAMWLLHVCCDTVGGLLKAIAWVCAGLAEALSGSSS